MGPRGALDTWHVDTEGRDEPAHLDVIAAELDEIATRLSTVAVTSSSGLPAALALRRFSIATKRLAESERAWFLPAQVEYMCVMPDEEVDPRMRLLEVDVFSMFVFGDLVLDAVGRTELEWRLGSTARWVDFVNYLDAHPDPLFLSVTRELQLALRSGRNMLVIHPHPRAFLGFGMDERGSVGLASITMEKDYEASYNAAGRILQEVADDVQFAYDPGFDYPKMLGVLTAAGRMNRAQRKRVETAMRLGNYITIPMPALASLVRDLARAHETSLRRRAAESVG